MSEHVVSKELDASTIEKIVFFYQDDAKEPSNEYIDFFAKNDDVSVTVYKKEKNGLRSVVFQGKKAVEEASLFFKVPQDEKKQNEPKTTHFDFFEQIGSDEVGTGDYFGPIVVAGSYVDKKGHERLKALGVTDSKKLSDDYILSIGPTLVSEFDYSLLRVSPETYNKQRERGYNMNSIKAVLHNRVLLNLSKKHPTAKCCIDQFAEPKLYFSYLSKEKEVQHDIIFSTKGELAFPSVALASCIARYHFLKKMEELSEELGEKVPFGAGIDVDEFAKSLQKRIGIEQMGKYVKLNFSNTKKLTETDEHD